VNYIRQYEIDRGVPNAQAYNHTLYLMAGLLVVGFVCNALVKPVDARHHLKDAATNPSGEDRSLRSAQGDSQGTRSGIPVLAAAWTGVGAPLAWGVVSTVGRALALFRR